MFVTFQNTPNMAGWNIVAVLDWEERAWELVHLRYNVYECREIVSADGARTAGCRSAWEATEYLGPLLVGI